MGIERVLVGTDFSPASIEATRWTARHFGRDAELVLAHVVAIPEPPPIVRGRFPKRELMLDTVRVGAETRLREISQSLGAPRIWLEVREGAVPSTLVGLARTYAANLMAVGAHGERAGAHAAMGSTAEQLVSAAEGPVLVVTGALPAQRVHLIVAMDGWPVDAEALRWASLLGPALGAPITVLHVAPTGIVARAIATVTSGARGVDAAAGRSADASPEFWLDRAVEAGVPRERATSEVVTGDAADEIVAMAARTEGALIVIGRRSAGAVRRAVLGSVTKAVLDRAPCPVLVVPERRPGGDA